MQNLLLITRKGAALLLALLAAPLWAASPGGATQVFQASDDTGGVRLLWWIAPDHWRPGGFRLEDDRGRVLIEHLAPSPASADRLDLTPGDKKELTEIAEKGAKAESAITLGLHALGSWDYARALGIAAEVTGLEQRPTGFVVRGLGKDGKPDGSFLQTKAIDLSGTTPLHSEPKALRGENASQGVSLLAAAGPSPVAHPCLSYRPHQRRGQCQPDPATPDPGE